MADLTGDFWDAATVGGTVVPTEPEYLIFGEDVSVDPDVRDMQDDIPSVDSLDPKIQTFIEDIKDLPKPDQAHLVHQFVTGNMQYSHTEAAGQDNVTFNKEDVLENWKTGDCDNHASMTGVLLEHVGFEKKDMALVSVNVTTGIEGGGSVSGPHGVLVAKIEDEQVLFDLNMAEPVTLNENYSATGPAAFDEYPDNEGAVRHVQFDEVLAVNPLDKEQNAVVFPDRLNALSSPDDGYVGGEADGAAVDLEGDMQEEPSAQNHSPATQSPGM